MLKDHAGIDGVVPRDGAVSPLIDERDCRPIFDGGPEDRRRSVRQALLRIRRRGCHRPTILRESRCAQDARNIRLRPRHRGVDRLRARGALRRQSGCYYSKHMAIVRLRPTGPAVEKLSWEATAHAMAASDEEWSAWDAAAGDGLDEIPSHTDEGRGRTP